MDLATDDIRLMFGDCLERMKEIESGSIDMVLTDPPYNSTACKWDSIIPLAPMWEQLKRIIKPNGAIVLMSQLPFDKVLAVSNLKMLKYEWIWEKTAATGFLNAKKSPLKAHENALVFYSRPPTYNPQMTEGATIKRVNASYANHGENYGKNSSIRAPYESTQRHPRSVLKYAKDNRLKSYHPTQKPVALMEYLLKTYTNEGETVLDFTMGSGTTGVAAVNTRRKFVGIERDAGYYGISCGRIMDATILSNSQSEGTL